LKGGRDGGDDGNRRWPASATRLQATNRLAEAEPLSGHAARIILASFGMDHPDTQKGKRKGMYLKILQANAPDQKRAQISA